MLNDLHEIERVLPQLLASSEGWKSLDVDYEPPRVERVYRAVGPHRVSLHVLHPCAPGRALFHPHPWPSAMRVLSGVYEMAVGAGSGDEAPPVALMLVARGPLEYEMTDPDGWHSVRPIGGPALSVMITGTPWSRWSPKSEAPLGPLPTERVAEILAMFRAHYPLR
jgi:hypothetical protein